MMFEGWSLEEGSHEANAWFWDLYDGCTLYAVWIEVIPILLDTETIVSEENGGEPVRFKFIPAADGVYRFYSYGYTEDTNPSASLRDSNNEEIAWNDNYGDNHNFSIFAELRAGETCYLYAGSEYEGGYHYYVKVEEVIPPHITLGANGGYFDSEEQTEVSVFYIEDWTKPEDLPVPTAPEGTVFMGWSMAEGSSNVVIKFGEIHDGDTLFAVWQSINDFPELPESGEVTITKTPEWYQFTVCTRAAIALS